MITALKKAIPANNLFLISDLTWTQLETIEASFQDIAGIRFTYLDGVLEIMNLSLQHQEAKFIISALLEAYMRSKRIRFYGKGSATLGSKNVGGKKEPDESYNLDTKKAIPDLVIEIIVSSGGINTLELYQRIGIPEVWFWEDGLLTIYFLKENQYQKFNRSQLLPELDLELLTKYINYHDQYDAVTEFLNSLG